MSQRIVRDIDSSTLFLLAGRAAGVGVEMYGTSIRPNSRATLEDKPAPGRTQRATIAADNLPLGHNC